MCVSEGGTCGGAGERSGDPHLSLSTLFLETGSLTELGARMVAKLPAILLSLSLPPNAGIRGEHMAMPGISL